MASSTSVQSILPRVAKGCVSQVMRQGDGFDQVFVEFEGAGDGTAQLRHFQRMRQPCAKQIAFVVQKNLGFVDQAPESGAVDDAVAISSELCAGGCGGSGNGDPAIDRDDKRNRLNALKQVLATSGDDFAHQRIGRCLHHALAGLVDQDEFDLARFGFFVDAHEF